MKDGNPSQQKDHRVEQQRKAEGERPQASVVPLRW
jgi:hypothetical protein